MKMAENIDEIPYQLFIPCNVSCIKTSRRYIYKIGNSDYIHAKVFIMEEMGGLCFEG